LAPNCALADGYATAFMAMGYEKAIALAASLEDIEVYLIFVNAEGALDQYMSEGFKQVVYEQAE
jgi:thiamine biosynthesis lipoprotein